MTAPYTLPATSHMKNAHPREFTTSNPSSTIAAYGVLLLTAIYYLLRYLDYTNLPILELFWSFVVYITPSSLISILDPTFKTTGVEYGKEKRLSLDSEMYASKSNAMRRILGLDTAGLIPAIQQARRFSDDEDMLTGTPGNSLPGLGNWDNSCYQNSVLQGLAALESLPGFLDDTTDSDISKSTTSALKEIIAKLNNPVNSGKTFWTPAKLKNMSSWQQQDAQEYFSKVADMLDKDKAQELKNKQAPTGLEDLACVKKATVRSPSPDTNLPLPMDSDVLIRKKAEIGHVPEELTAMISRSPLEGLLAQRVGCQRCGYVEGLSLVPFNCLTVPLGRQWIYDVRSCLDEYTALESISGVECGKCTLLHTKQSVERLSRQIKEQFSTEKASSISENQTSLQLSLEVRLRMLEQALENGEYSDSVLKNCQIPTKNRVSTTKSRQAVIARAPKALVIHINRSNFDELTGVQSKNRAKVTFPPRFDLAPWYLGQGRDLDTKNNDTEVWNVDPSQSMLSLEDDIEQLSSENLYELRAVITHYGHHENGHYICYRKAPITNKGVKQDVHESNRSWWRLSDEDVNEVDEEMVLGQGGVFMLFYEQSKPQALPENLQVPPPDPEMATASVKDDEDQQPSSDAATSPIEEGSSFIGKDPTEEILNPPHALPKPPSSPSIDTVESNSAGETKLGEMVMDTKDTNLPHTSSPMPSFAPELQDTLSGLTFEHPSRPPTNPHPSSAQPEITAPNPDKPISIESPNITPTLPKLKESRTVSPVSMKTAIPRHSRSSGNRAGKAMGSVAGVVQAN